MLTLGGLSGRVLFRTLLTLAVVAFVAGVLLVCTSSPSPPIHEPEYQGQTLSYWMEHWYSGYQGGQPAVNPQAVEAVQHIGTNALPFFIQWLDTPYRSLTHTDYQARALHGFEVLGPAAKPAIPDLIGMIGRNANYPALALAAIGKDAVPALIDVLVTNQAADSYGNWRRGVPPGLIRANAIEALSYLGTSAEAALPVLTACLPDEHKRSRVDVCYALACIGRNRPDIVVPALIQALTNSPAYRRISAIHALATFGVQGTSAVPALQDMSRDTDPEVRIQAAIAVKTISPETPNALAPLISNLADPDIQVRRNAFRALDSLGTNGTDALPAAVASSLHEPDPEARALAIRCMTRTSRDTNEVLRILRHNITNENESVACEAAGGLAGLAQTSQPLFLELLSVTENNRHRAVQTGAALSVHQIMRHHPEFLIQCLDDPDPAIRSCAFRTFQALRRDVLVVAGHPTASSTNQHYYRMSQMSDEDKQRYRQAIPRLIQALQDDSFEIRRYATNILLAIDPRVAADAGVITVPPYSFYAK